MITSEVVSCVCATETSSHYAWCVVCLHECVCTAESINNKTQLPEVAAGTTQQQQSHTAAARRSSLSNGSAANSANYSDAQRPQTFARQVSTCRCACVCAAVVDCGTRRDVLSLAFAYVRKRSSKGTDVNSHHKHACILWVHDQCEFKAHWLYACLCVCCLGIEHGQYRSTAHWSYTCICIRICM